MTSDFCATGARRAIPGLLWALVASSGLAADLARPAHSLLATARPAAKSEPLNTTVLGRWPSGPCRAGVLQGHTAFYADGAFLVIADAADPGAPRELGRVACDDLVLDIAVDGDLVACAAGAAGLVLVNAADTGHPFAVGAIATTGWAQDIALRDGRGFVADDQGGLLVVDIADPANPVLLAQAPVSGPASAVSLDEALAVVTDFAGGMTVFDISAPTDPLTRAENVYGDWIEDVALADSVAYVACGPDGVRLIDLADPLEPVEIARFDTPSFARAVAYAEGYLWVADTEALRVWDVQAAAAPVEVAVYTPGDVVWSVALAQDQACVAADGMGLRLLSATNPSAPTFLGCCPTSDNTTGIARVGATVFTVDQGRGLSWFDLSDPAAPQVLDRVAIPGAPSCIEVRDGVAFVGESVAGLWTVDLETGTAVRSAGEMAGVGAHDIVLAQEVAYVAGGPAGARVFDIADPAAPLELAPAAQRGPVTALAIHGHYLIAAAREAGLRVWDTATDPRQPAPVTALGLPGPALDIHMAGDLAIVAAAEGGLAIVDAADPRRLSILGTVPTEQAALAVAVEDSLAFVAEGFGGVEVIDFHTPESPVLVARAATGGAAVALAVANGEMAVANLDHGVVMIRYDNPTATWLTFFDVEPTPGAVWISWSITAPDAPAQRLLAIQPGVPARALTIQETGPGRYQANDRDAGLIAGNSVTYVLVVQDQGNWVEATRRTVTVPALPQGVALVSAAPNPFNPRTVVTFAVDRPQVVELTIVDLAGRRVATLSHAVWAAGRHSVVWDGSDDSGRPAADGAYLLRLEAEGGRAVRRLTLVR